MRKNLTFGDYVNFAKSRKKKIFKSVFQKNTPVPYREYKSFLDMTI